MEKILQRGEDCMTILAYTLTTKKVARLLTPKGPLTVGDVITYSEKENNEVYVEVQLFKGLKQEVIDLIRKNPQVMCIDDQFTRTGNAIEIPNQ